MATPTPPSGNTTTHGVARIIEVLHKAGGRQLIWLIALFCMGMGVLYLGDHIGLLQRDTVAIQQLEKKVKMINRKVDTLVDTTAVITGRLDTIDTDIRGVSEQVQKLSGQVQAIMNYGNRRKGGNGRLASDSR